MNIRWSSIFVCAGAVLLAGCASVQQFVTAPEVRLREVQVENIDVSGQKFLLSFDVANPNPFPLPISTIRYALALGGHAFASGESASSFTVPARGDGEFALSVDLNLLQTAPELLLIARDGLRREIDYSLQGELGVDLPYAKPVAFGTEGQVRLRTAGY